MKISKNLVITDGIYPLWAGVFCILKSAYLNLLFASLAVLLGAAILLLPAYDNGYVFLFQDSSDYLADFVRFYRLPIYGYFALIGRVFGSPWAIAIIQSLIIAHLIYLLNKVTFKKVNPIWYLAQIGVLTAFSSLPWVSAEIMADIFTPILFLGLYLLLFHRKTIDVYTKTYLKALVIFAAMAHITNIYLGVGLLIFATFVILLRNEERRANFKIIGRGMGLLAVSALYVMGLNAYYFKTWTLSPASSVFTFANLVQHGTARAYLEGACSNQSFKICDYLHVMPDSSDSFLWSRKSPLDKGLGSFRGFSEEAKDIVKNIIVSYPKDVAYHAAQDFAQTFTTHTPAKELNSSVARSSVRGALRIFYGVEERTKFYASRAANDSLQYDLIAKIDNIVFPSALILCAIFGALALRNLRDNRAQFALFALVFVLGNNFLCAIGSGVFDRYQARVTWLLVLAVMLMAGYWWKMRNEISTAPQSVGTK